MHARKLSSAIPINRRGSLSKSVEQSASTTRNGTELGKEDKSENSKDGIERDAEGFIITDESTRGFTDPKPSDGFEDSDDEEKVEKINPIVIRPAEEAQVASLEDIRKFSAQLSIPAPGSNSGRNKITAPQSGRSRRTPSINPKQRRMRRKSENPSGTLSDDHFTEENNDKVGSPQSTQSEFPLSPMK